MVGFCIFTQTELVGIALFTLRTYDGTRAICQPSWRPARTRLCLGLLGENDVIWPHVNTAYIGLFSMQVLG